MKCFTTTFKLCSEYSIRKVQGNRVGLKLNWVYKLLAYAYDVNLLEDNTDTANKNTETLIYASRKLV
jgi:hypothetical protein